jgi:anhydro-N-acetylmuramic acid kinase
MPVNIIGIMSGSSLDGLDMALCRFEDSTGIPDWTIVAKHHVPFPATLLGSLRSAPSMSGHDLMKLDADFGSFIGSEISAWMDTNTLAADVIASHGHTIFHEPTQGFTTQIGSGAHIAFLTGVDTITSFRAADVAAGGQGAPFAPVADRDLFKGYQAYINLGGIANVSMVLPDGKRKAWDICPCNQALNYLAAKTGMAYDHEGQMAASGMVDAAFVTSLVDMFPFNAGQPKGLSNAEVEKSWIKSIDKMTSSENDLLASVTEAIAILIHSHLRPLAGSNANVLVTGGGAHNAYLMERLNALSTGDGFAFAIPAEDIINYKECVLMAYLGYLTTHTKPYGIARMTGATRDSIGGALYKACR